MKFFHCSFWICSVCFGYFNSSITVGWVSLFSSHSHPATCWPHPMHITAAHLCQFGKFNSLQVNLVVRVHPKTAVNKDNEQADILHQCKKTLGETQQLNDQPRCPTSPHRDKIACKPHPNFWQLCIWTHMCLVTIKHKWRNGRKKKWKRGKKSYSFSVGEDFLVLFRKQEEDSCRFSGNGLINFGCLFELVILTGRVTGAESRSKCGHWMMVCRWWLLFPEPLATGPSPVG